MSTHDDALGQMVEAHLGRCDDEAGSTYFVTVGAREPGTRGMDALHPDRPLSLDAARWLGWTLIELAGQAEAQL